MADINSTSLHYFIYVCILQASSVPTTTCNDHHVFMVSFLSKMNYFGILAGLFFSNRKNKPIKRTEQFISPIKSIPVNVLTCYQCSKSRSLVSFVYDSFVSKKLFICIYIYIYIYIFIYIALSNSSVNKYDFICGSRLLNAHLWFGD